MTPSRRLFQRLGLLLVLAAVTGPARATTFVDRWDADDLRVVSYNIYFDSAFGPRSGADAATTDRFRRVVTALNPDVLALQEVYNTSATTVATLLNNLLPLSDGGRWYTYKRSDSVIASRYPFITNGGSVGHADVLIDLPNDRYQSNLYVISDHWPCCSDDQGRQNESNQLVKWIADRKGTNALPQGTPFIVVGDLNTVEVGVTPPSLETLLTGDATDPQFDAGPLDWDGTRLTDALPKHNGAGPDNYTWRDDSDIYDPGILDHIVFSDSVLETASRFILNTREMSESDLAATGLQADDIMVNATQGFYDHLPLVVDFRERPVVVVGDYNRDGVVDAGDHAVWDVQYNGISAPSADGNGDGVVNAADYTVWRDAYAASLTATAVPEPSGLILVLAATYTSCWRRHRD